METLGDYACQAIAKSWHKVTKSEAGVLQDLDPEPLHQMRVGMRRLRTVLGVFQPAIALPRAVSDRRIQKLAQTLGEVRDLDVLQQDLVHRYRPHLPKPEQKYLDKVVDKLQQQRQHHFRDLVAALESDHYQGLQQHLQTWLSQPTWKPLAQLPILMVLPDLLLPLVSQLLLHPGWLVGNSDPFQPEPSTPEPVTLQLSQLTKSERECLHDLRKQIKRVRYQTEIFTDCYGPDYETQIQEWQNLQEILGQLQDSFVLGRFLAKSLKVNLDRALPTLAEQMQQQQLQCWQQWQPFQQRYLNPEVRQALRLQMLLSPPAASQPAA